MRSCILRFLSRLPKIHLSDSLNLNIKELHLVTLRQVCLMRSIHFFELSQHLFFLRL